MIPRLRQSLGRVRRAAWPVAQAALAAGIAWFLAFRVLGHAQPVFAPTAAVVALAANVGSRGRQAVKMLVGVGLGVTVGELLVLVMGTGTLQVTIASGISMLAAAALLHSPLPLIQAVGPSVTPLSVSLPTLETVAGAAPELPWRLPGRLPRHARRAGLPCAARL